MRRMRELTCDATVFRLVITRSMHDSPGRGATRRRWWCAAGAGSRRRRGVSSRRWMGGTVSSTIILSTIHSAASLWGEESDDHTFTRLAPSTHVTCHVETL